MAGYIGTKAVLLSTTAATVAGDATIGGDLNVDTNTLFVDSANNRVGMGTGSPAQLLELSSTSPAIQLTDTDTGARHLLNGSSSVGNFKIDVDLGADGSDPNFIIDVAGSEAMRIDASGNLLVGGTSTTVSTDTSGDQLAYLSSGVLHIKRSNPTAAATLLALNRSSTSDGNFINFNKQGTTVGAIGNVSTSLFIESGVGYQAGFTFRSTDVLPRRSGASADNVMDLGDATYRFDDIYATNGTIQTSDRNEKQDIEALSEAEQRVAVACKGLLRKFRWKDAVAEKGDDARIHFGIIAQDLQAAFAAEGLDAGRYAMFISTTWWETQTDVPAVEAVAEVLDEDGNVVTEAVEAKEAYTRTDTYETLEEAPEGATERTRLGVRYPELLAFIIGAM